MPDYVMFHLIYGTRWVELKTSDGKLSSRQKEMLVIMQRHGASVYVLNGKDDYDLLFKPSNLTHYLLTGKV